MVWHQEEPIVSTGAVRQWMRDAAGPAEGDGHCSTARAATSCSPATCPTSTCTCASCCGSAAIGAFAHEAWRVARHGRATGAAPSRAAPSPRRRAQPARADVAEGRTRPVDDRGAGRPQAAPAPRLHDLLAAVAAALRGPQLDGVLARSRACRSSTRSSSSTSWRLPPTRSSSTVGTGACCARA